MSCSWTQYSGSAGSETRTSNSSIPSLMLHQPSHCPPHANSTVSCADAGIYVMGVQVHLTKKYADIFFFSPQLILQKSNGNHSKKTINFQGSRGSPTFSRGWGSNCLFPVETHITCDFPRGIRTPCPPPPLPPPPPPPSGSAHECLHSLVKYLLTSTKRCYLSDQFQFLNMK